MIDKLARAVVRVPWLFVALFLGITIAVGTRIPEAELEAEVKAMLPEDMPARVNVDKIEELFGGTDMLMVVLTADDVLAPETLRRVKKLSRAIERTKGVDRVLSLFALKDIRAESGNMVVDPAVKKIPRTSEAREALRAQLKDNELVYGNVVGKGFRATAIIAMLGVDAKDADILPAFEAVIAANPGPEPTVISGMPFVRTQMAKYMRGDLQRLLPIGLLVMLAFLFVCFRQLRGVVLPFAVVAPIVVSRIG